MLRQRCARRIDAKVQGLPATEASIQSCDNLHVAPQCLSLVIFEMGSRTSTYSAACYATKARWLRSCADVEENAGNMPDHVEWFGSLTSDCDQLSCNLRWTTRNGGAHREPWQHQTLNCLPCLLASHDRLDKGIKLYADPDIEALCRPCTRNVRSETSAGVPSHALALGSWWTLGPQRLLNKSNLGSCNAR